MFREEMARTRRNSTSVIDTTLLTNTPIPLIQVIEAPKVDVFDVYSTTEYKQLQSKLELVTK